MRALHPTEQAIVEAVRGVTQPVTAQEIADLSGYAVSTCRRYLGGLVYNGILLTRDVSRGGGRAAIYWHPDTGTASAR